jgi:glycyl-tRNA synthetase alpha chain
LARSVAEAYFQSRRILEFPLAPEELRKEVLALAAATEKAEALKLEKVAAKKAAKEAAKNAKAGEKK